MDPITDHMRNVSLNHRAAESGVAKPSSGKLVDGAGASVPAATAATGMSDRSLLDGTTKEPAPTGEVSGKASRGTVARAGAGDASDASGSVGAEKDAESGDRSCAAGVAAAAATGANGDDASGAGDAGKDGKDSRRGGGKERSDRTESVASRSSRRGSRDGPDPAGTVSYNADHIIGNGSFGVVFQAVVVETGEVVAIKKVLQDKRFKNRELQIMRMLVKKEHPNIVCLKHCFYSNGDKPDELYLNLVLEFVPETVYSVARQYHKSKQTLPVLLVKLYLYQLARALAHIHALGICHRDIKPQNLLLDPQSHVLKLCDFGSAKILVRGEPNVSYICSRYYRAPELIFGSTDYTCAIDTWSLGCVAAELLLGEPLFPGDSGVDQLVEIIKVLGTPTREEIRAMNYNYSEFKFPQIKAHPWKGVFRSRTPPEALDVVGKMLAYDPLKRIKPLEVCSHEFVDELRQEGVKLPNGKQMPQLFEFTELELSANPGLLSFLLPTEVGGSGGGDGGGNHKSLVGSTDATAPASAAGAASGASSATTTVEGQEAGLGQA